MTKLIGLGGRLRSGKDTIADYLVEKHGWVKLNMSDPLADALYTLNPQIYIDDYDLPVVRGHWTYQEIVDTVGYVEAKRIPEVRRLLQTLGTEVGRNMISETVWVDIADRRISELLDAGLDVAITGIRFPQEIEMIQSYEEGETWWVARPEVENGVVTHTSESSLGPTDFDVIVNNNGDLEELYAKVELVLSR